MTAHLLEGCSTTVAVSPTAAASTTLQGACASRTIAYASISFESGSADRERVDILRERSVRGDPDREPGLRRRDRLHLVFDLPRRHERAAARRGTLPLQSFGSVRVSRLRRIERVTAHDRGRSHGHAGDPGLPRRDGERELHGLLLRHDDRPLGRARAGHVHDPDRQQPVGQRVPNPGPAPHVVEHRPGDDERGVRDRRGHLERGPPPGSSSAGRGWGGAAEGGA